MRLLPEANLVSHYTSKLELSAKNFNRFNNNTVTGNSISSSNSKQKRATHTEPSSRKKKIILTGDFMVNGISEKGLSVNHKVKTVKFPGGTSEKILEKLDGTIKEKPDNLIVHAGINDITNNVNLSVNVK